MLYNYEYSKGTLAILPNDDNTSLVFEDENRYVIHRSTSNIIEDSCLYFGSSLEGRKMGAKEILGAEYKVPIVIEESNNIIAFPTTSPYSPTCSWLSFNRILKIDRIDANNSKVIFDNNVEILVPCSFRILENQLSRAARLDLVTRKRKNKE